ncbi:MAG TPA: hypothetical protein VFK44_15215 [Bacillales bacterium]|nr:hypothetical protein [Bacillales bacterium]
MQITQVLLAVCIFVLLGMIFYSYSLDQNLGWILKGWLFVCFGVYAARLVIIIRNKK